MELTAARNRLVSLLAPLERRKAEVLYCGLGAASRVVLLEDVWRGLGLIAQKQLLRCLHRLCAAHSLSMLAGASRLSLESIQQGHVGHMMVLSPLPGGAPRLRGHGAARAQTSRGSSPSASSKTSSTSCSTSQRAATWTAATMPRSTSSSAWRRSCT